MEFTDEERTDIACNSHSQERKGSLGTNEERSLFSGGSNGEDSEAFLAVTSVLSGRRESSL